MVKKKTVPSNIRTRAHGHEILDCEHIYFQLTVLVRLFSVACCTVTAVKRRKQESLRLWICYSPSKRRKNESNFFGWKSKGSNSIAAENLLHTKNLVSKSKWLVRASCATISMHTHWILRMLVQRYEHFFSSLFVRCWFCFTFSQKEAQRKKVTIRSNATKIYFQMGRGRETVIVVVR